MTRLTPMKLFRAASLALALVLPATPGFADDDDAPPPTNISAAVQTMPARRGALPETLVAIGTIGPASDGSTTISRQIDGQIQALHVTAGQGVAAGQALLDFAPSAAARSSWQQAVTAAQLAHDERARTAQLLGQQLATRSQMAQAEKAESDAAQTLDALRRSGADAATQTLRAPFAGIVTSIAVQPGDRVAVGAALLSLLRQDALVLTVGVPPSLSARVRPGQPAQLLPLEGTGVAAPAQVLRVDAMLNPRSRLVDADLGVPADALAGAAYRARITIGQFQGWLVPRDAALPGDDADDPAQAVLFQVAGGHAKRVAVRVLGSQGAVSVVDGPIDPALPVIVQGNNQLNDGMAVRATAAPATPAL